MRVARYVRMEYDDRSTTFIIRTDAYYGSNSYDDLPLGTVGGFFVCTLAVALFTCRVLKRYALEMFFRSFGRRVDRFDSREPRDSKNYIYSTLDLLSFVESMQFERGRTSRIFRKGENVRSMHKIVMLEYVMINRTAYSLYPLFSFRSL